MNFQLIRLVKKTIMFTMKSKGEIIRIIRDNKKISLNCLEKISGISGKKIGRFERGEGLLSEKTISVIEKKMKVCLSEQINIFEEINQLFFQYVDSLYYSEDNDDFFLKKTKSLYIKNSLRLNEEKLELISYIINYRKNSQNKQDEVILLKLEMSEDKQISALYNLYKALEYMVDNPSKSLNYTNKISFKLENKKIIALLYLNLIDIYMNSQDYFTVFNYLNQAKYLFGRDLSMKNSLLCDFKYAEYYKRIGCKELAVETYNLFLIGFEQVNIDSLYYNKSYLQICDIYLQMNLYEKALDQLSNLSFDSDIYPNSFIYEIWALIKLKKIEEAINVIDKISKLDVEFEYDEILQLFRLMVIKTNKKNNCKKIKFATNLYKYFRKTRNYELQNFYLDIIIDELNKQSLFEKLKKYHEIKIKLLKK